MSTKKELKRDYYFGIGIICFSLLFIVSTYLTVDGRGDVFITGRSFPYFIGIVLFILGCCLLFSRIKLLNSQNYEDTKHSTVTKAQVKRIMVYLVVLVCYGLGIAHIGYIVSTSITLMFLMVYVGAENKVTIALSGCIIPIVMWYVFTILMEVQFPQALLL